MRRVGLALGSGGRLGVTTARRVYEALAPLRCARCRRVIATGDLFTRRRVSETVGAMPTCRACAPFSAPG
jgi:hypothetical protein